MEHFHFVIVAKTFFRLKPRAVIANGRVNRWIWLSGVFRQKTDLLDWQVTSFFVASLGKGREMHCSKLAHDVLFSHTIQRLDKLPGNYKFVSLPRVESLIGTTWNHSITLFRVWHGMNVRFFWSCSQEQAAFDSCGWSSLIRIETGSTRTIKFCQFFREKSILKCTCNKNAVTLDGTSQIHSKKYVTHSSI